MAATAAPTRQDAQSVTLITSEWPPFNIANDPAQGAAIPIARAAFAAVGFRLTVNFYPYNRVLQLVRERQVVGYIYDYYDPGFAKEFLASSVIFRSPIGIAEPVKNQVRWRTIADLAQYRLGVVEGYVNRADLDARIAAGKQPVDEAVDDAHNLYKLAAGRVAGAIIDYNVFNYLVRTDPRLTSAQRALDMNKQVLDEKALYGYFIRTPEGTRLRQLFDEGLKRIDSARILTSNMRRMGFE
jgi:polar amino acid transport system substrate-binding protein